MAPRLGRQPADHSRSDREMLRVRIPPEPLEIREGRTTTSSPCRAARSARHPVKVEAAGSNPAGGAGRGREIVIKSSSSLKRVGWALASPGGRNPPAPSFAGSTPARRTAIFFDPSNHGPVVYRSRTPLSHSGKAGSTPVRATSNQALCSGARSKQPRRGGHPAGSHKAGPPGSTPGPGTHGWAGAQPSLMNWEDVVRLPYPQ
jgi:hypothetical protein